MCNDCESSLLMKFDASTLLIFQLVHTFLIPHLIVLTLRQYSTQTIQNLRNRRNLAMEKFKKLKQESECQVTILKKHIHANRVILLQVTI